jgi:hypothetical protein
VALKAGISVCDCAIVPGRWEDTGIYLLEPPDRIPFYANIARFEYPKDDVLNHWISGGHTLGMGEMPEGILIAQSFTRPPDWCRNGMAVEIELCFFDQFDNPYPLNVELRVIRFNERVEDAKRHHGLFDGMKTSEGHPLFAVNATKELNKKTLKNS